MRYVNPEKVVREHLGNNPMPRWNTVIMCFHSKGKTEKLAKIMNARLVGYRIFSKCDETVVYEAIIDGKRIGILGWCTGGGPLVASLIEELSVLGVKRILGLGAAASISEEVMKYDLVVATDLLVNDGLSKCYIDDKDWIRINQPILDTFRDVTSRILQDIKEVKGATVEALYRQTDEVVESWRIMGCNIVNWELTPFYAASEICEIQCLWMGHISDVEINTIWDDWYGDREFIFEKCVEICVRLIRRLEGNGYESKL